MQRTIVDLIVEAGLVVTMDRPRTLITGGALAVDKGRIIAVDTKSSILKRFSSNRTIGGERFIALPGFVDGHSHAGHGLVRTMGSDDFPAFREACRKIYMEAASIDFWRAEARLSALERLKAGVTTAAVYLGGGDENNRSDTPEVAENYAAAFTTVGPSIILGIGPSRPPYPRMYHHFKNGSDHAVPVDFDRQLEVCDYIARSIPSAKINAEILAKTGTGLTEIRTYDDHPTAYLALADGRVDGVLNTFTTLTVVLKDQPGKYAIVQNVGQPNWAGFVTREEDTELRQFFNEELLRLKANGTLAKLQEKWFGVAMSLPDTVPTFK